ncbi:hypothetical protein AKJ40_03435 [candidate division MSBL1 archaeon SCGC-AAA259M10]|uniref:Transcription regulator AsnC/Lrp ligand binding domain-containing protein n=1 Tax=candidate division MSBL1 archaeon SCGC-AAA259M10 TaxID=1698270 RepID=A0A133UYL5_9EURY|nr:hypothetical protein AKJ40_03435 [candidate division MSBL1 archaeon SCGC-AAA259M10]
MVCLVEALILINTTSGVMDKVHEEVKNIKEVRKATKADGPHDIIAIVEIEAVGEIRDALMDKIRSIKGVKETTTNLIIG